MEYKKEGYCPTCNKFNIPIKVPFFIQKGRYCRNKYTTTGTFIQFYYTKKCEYSCDCGTKWVEENEC